jgi:uncharacterized protein
VRKILIATLIVTATSTLTLAASPPLAVQTGAADHPLMAAPVGVSPLASAARARDFAAVQALLKKKPDVNQRMGDGTTALDWAVRWNDVETAKRLIKARADVNAATPLGATPLYLASLNGSPEMIKLLLGAKADPNQRVLASEATPLMYAARSGSVESVQLLLKAGADINALEGYRGTTALMWAAERNNDQIVSLLLSNGADAAINSKVSERTTSGKAPTKNSAPPDPNLAKPQQDPSGSVPAPGDGGSDPRRFTPPPKAGGSDSGDFTPTPRTDGSDSSDSTTPPAKAPAKSGPPKLKEPQGGVTALILASRENALRTVKVLLDAGAPVNEQSGDGSTALLVAVQNVHLEMARLLLAHGADVNISNKKGWNPLYIAIKDRSMEYGTMPPPPIDRDDLLALIQQLLAKGANVNARINDDTEMRNAIKATWLNEAGATPFLRASLCGDYTVMKLLLEHGADPKIPTQDGTTALAALAGVGFTKGFMEDIEGTDTSIKALRLLIDSGIDVNAANKDNVTALHGAAHKNFVGAIQLLVEHGGDLTVVSQRRGTFERSKEFKGNTVLDWAYGVQTGGEAAVFHPEAVALVEKLMKERNLPLVRFGYTDGGVAAAGRPAGEGR